ncbi:tetratricopeptide repeat protein [Actinomyces sp. 565]|uniref:tetratricopeptide repeat protein n=1 Tax=Actinomyces sp. 565 TaxID=2057794 RepID=UPI0013A6B2C7|nr:tetratricopeptide repeat protein [Actinomyces sp. 565]NDR53358.1 tetratricopeptide repeat protein [Actinomyces sp. 565]
MTYSGAAGPQDPQAGSAGLPGENDAYRPGARSTAEAHDYAVRAGIADTKGPEAESPQHRRARLARRRRLLAWQGVPAVVVAVIAVWMLVVSGLTFAANHAAVSGNYAAAVDRYGAVVRLNPWLEQWRVHYNLGTAQLLDDRLDAAVGELEEALVTAPAAGTVQVKDEAGNTVTVLDPQAPECLVRVNLYTAHASLADVAQDGGDSATAEAQWDAAMQAAGQCEVPPPPDPASEPDPSAQSDPSSTATASASGESTPSGGSTGTPTPEPTGTGQSSQQATPPSSPSPTPGDSRRRELEERNGEANSTGHSGLSGGDGRRW